MKCIRAECDNDLHVGKKFCSTRCAALYRHEQRRLRQQIKEVITFDRRFIPDSVEKFIQAQVGQASGVVLEEMQDTMKERIQLQGEAMAIPELEADKPVAPTYSITEKDYDIAGMYYGIGDVRPADALSYEIIEQMMKSGAVVFITEMKKASLLSVFRSPTSVKVRCQDEDLRSVVEANLRQVLPIMANDFLDSAMYWGASFQELVWKYTTRYELGLSKSRGSSKLYAVIDMPNSVRPSTVKNIIRTPGGDFNGFVQQSKLGYREIVVDANRSLIITNQKRFGNLWGTSMLKPMYPIWYWYEHTLRSMVRYMERMATPVAVCYAPTRAQVTMPGTTTKVSGLKWGLMLAGAAAKSNAIAIPSDTHQETNQPLWKLEYLTAEDRGQLFVAALENLFQQLVRSGMTADRTTTQESGGVGSYAIGKVHEAATQLHNEMMLTGVVGQLNRYFVPKYALYNIGYSAPPIWLETEGLDIEEKQRLQALIGIAGNRQDLDALNYVDWRKLFELQNTPTLTDEEMAAKEEEKAKKALKAQQAMVKAAGPPNRPGNGFKETNSNEQDDDQGQEPAIVNQKKLEQVAADILSGKSIPILLSDSEAMRIWTGANNSFRETTK